MGTFNFLRRSFGRKHPSGQQVRRRPRLLLEALEERALLTAYVFVDFGDNFPLSGSNRVLSTTSGAVRDVNDVAFTPNLVIQGPQLTDINNNGYADNTAVSFTQFNFTAEQRAQMMAIARRAFAGLDVTVVELTATAQTLADGRTVAGTTNMRGISDTLRSGQASHDVYIIAATPAIGASNDNPNNFARNGYGGIAPGGNILGDDTDLRTARNDHDDLVLAFTVNNVNGVANTIVHEAGHAFGLRHAVTTAAPAPPPGSTATPINNTIHTSEVMSYLSGGGGATSEFFFSRFPMVRGDNNTDTDNTTSPPTPPTLNNNDLEARRGQQTPFDQLRDDPSVGENPNLHYISGTGAHDIITITRGSGNKANVTVQAFTDNTYTTAIIVPGTSIPIYSYTVDLDRRLLVQDGLGDDRIIIDGALNVRVDVDGMDGNDEVIINDQTFATLATSYTVTATEVSRLRLDNFGIVVPTVLTVGYVGIEEVILNTGGSSSGALVNVDSNATNLKINLGSFLNVVTIGGGRLDAVGGHVEVRGSGGYDALVLNDASNTSNFLWSRLPTYTLNVNSVNFTQITQQYGMYRWTHSVDIVYTGMEQLDVRAGDTWDDINIHTHDSNVHANIYAGGGGDAVRFAPLSGNLDSVPGVFTIEGGEGGDSLTFSDQSLQNDPFWGTTNHVTYTVDSQSVSRVNVVTFFEFTWTTSFQAGHKEFETLEINGGTTGNVFNIRGTTEGAQTTFRTGSGADRIVVGAAINHLQNVLSSFTVEGGEGIDVLEVHDEFNPYTDMGFGSYEVADTYVRAGNYIYHTGLDEVQLNTSNKPDYVTVYRTRAAVPLTISTNDGEDTVTIGYDTLDLVPGLLKVYGGAGGNTLVVNDSATMAPATWTRSATSIVRERTEAGTQYRTQIDHANMQNVTINAGRSVNTLRGTQSAGDPAALSMVLPIGGASADDSYAMAVDAAGNIYVTGYIQGTVDMDPGPGVTNLTQVGEYDAFLAKYSPAGSLLWARNLDAGTGGTVAVFDIKVDSAGNVYACGYFNGTLALGATTLTSPSYDGFVAKFDSSGNALWATQLSGSGYDTFAEMTLDAAGNVYVSGQFSATATFGGMTVTSRGQEDGLIAKVSSTGVVKWVERFGDAGSDSGWSMAADAAGNLYLAGTFSESIHLGSRTFTSAGAEDGYLAKLDNRGQVLWAQQFGGTLDDYAQDVALDAAGNVYLVGTYQGTATIGTATMTSVGGVDEFVAKFSNSGKLLWNRSMGSAADDWAGGFAVDAAGNVYYTGWFEGPGTFEGQTSTATTYTGYLGKLNAAGNSLWTQVWGNGTGGAWGYYVSLGQEGQIYVVGGLDGRSDQDPGVSTFNMDSAGDWDAAVYRFTEAHPLSLKASAQSPNYELRVVNGDVQLVDAVTGTIVKSGPVGEITAVNFRGASGVDTKLTIDASAANVSVTFAGASGSDTLVGPNTGNNWIINGVNAGQVGNVVFTSVENLVGGNLSDRFSLNMSGRVTGSLDGGLGASDELDFSAYTTSVKVNLALGKATNIGGGVKNLEHVTGGSGNDLLVGNAAANTLQGGAGRDVIIGGFGADTLLGGLDDDLLIGSSTIYDQDATALGAILSEWSSSRSYAARIEKLRSGVGSGRRVKLNAAAIRTDTAANVITGNEGLDWFFGILDEITDENWGAEVIG